MPQAEARGRISMGVRTTGAAASKPRTRRLRSIALALEKIAIFVAMAVLTYLLIAVDTRVNTPTYLFKTVAVRKV
jgi:hypothetical protein